MVNEVFRDRIFLEGQREKMMIRIVELWNFRVRKYFRFGLV